MRKKNLSVAMNLHPTLTDFLFYVEVDYQYYDQELVITSGSELTTKHMRTSLHYSGQAVDIRTKNGSYDTTYQAKRLRNVAAVYCREYGIPIDWFDVVAESDHLHLEYQPKRPT
tara:strand:+ start:20955 stop:21296 length:342 start_codon:yes stop_codon:yes gene_type:complete